MKPITIGTILEVTNGRLLFGDINQTIDSVTTNSREMKPGGLFVPIRGEKVDGHRFLSDALQVGAAALTEVDNPCEYVEGHSYLLVEDCLLAMQKLAAWYRSCFPQIPVIGVTGSVGKTTTKEMIAAALEEERNVLKTRGNMNSQIGLSLMMFELDDSIDLAVIEMGISEPDEMQRLVAIAKPETAVVTNIGVSHIGQLGSRENIRKEKLNIINSCTKDGKIYLWGDNDLLGEMKEAIKIDCSKETSEKLTLKTPVFYGEGEDNDVRALNVKTKGEHTTFDINIGKKILPIELSVLGIHHVNNALVAYAIARQYGVSSEAARRGLEAYQPMAMRGVATEHNGYTVIDDTYNASPDSLKSGLSVLFAKPCKGRRIAILGDVLELGEQSESCHREVGKYLISEYEKHPLDMLLTVGTQSTYIGKEIEEAKLPVTILYTHNQEEATEQIRNLIQPEDLILVKGSRGMHLDLLVKSLLA